MARLNDTHGLITPSPKMLASADSLALSAGEILFLIGRVLLGWYFLIDGVGKFPNITPFVGYVTSLGVPSPYFMAWVGAIAEFLVGLMLVFGIATRYGALLGILFVIIASVLAHRYWQYPAAQQLGQYINLMKNSVILGGMVLMFVIGPGRYSVDAWLRRRG
jgi:putative oxidoreductase